jgi:hypothetical protein
MALLPRSSYAELRELAARLRTGAAVVGLGQEVVEMVARIGQAPTAELLDALADEREASERLADQRIELVWSGPEQEGAGSRETAAVVRQMFGSAERFVLISGYSVYDGASILGALAERWNAQRSLTCWCCLNIQRANNDQRPDEEIVREYADNFFRWQWPWEPRPALFYDPRALATEPSVRAVLHAKCVVVDERQALVTSANLTEAAYYRNIECGVLVNDGVFARQLTEQFRGLVRTSMLLAVPTSLRVRLRAAASGHSKDGDEEYSVNG